MTAVRLLLPLCLVFFAADPSRAAGEAVVIVSSERGGAYQEATEALVAELERGGLARSEVQQIAVAELRQTTKPTARLSIALGTEACATLAKREAREPVLCTLLPRMSFERVLRDSGRRASAEFTALYLNQPLGRQLDLVRLALPQARRIGVLLGEESKGLAPALENAARARDLKLSSVSLGRDEPVFNGLKTVLETADVLLALPEPQIYNSGSIQNILLTSYRARVPMVAFSPAYVRAGALLAVYTSPSQLGWQAAQWARGVLQGKALPMPQYPQEFSVSVNEYVARSMGLNLDPMVLSERLRRLEQMP